MYSQFGEDDILAEIFGDKKDGRLLDIGAWDPKTFSNSRMLIERGWSALLFEFSPRPLDRLVVEYTSGAIQIVAAAVGIQHGMVSMRISEDGLSGYAVPHLKTWAETGGFYGRMWVPMLSLEDIWAQWGGNFDMVSIDTEGTSADLALQYLKAAEAGGSQPKAFVIEHDSRQGELIPAAQAAGYVIRGGNGTNIILERRS